MFLRNTNNSAIVLFLFMSLKYTELNIGTQIQVTIAKITTKM